MIENELVCAISLSEKAQRVPRGLSAGACEAEVWEIARPSGRDLGERKHVLSP